MNKRAVITAILLTIGLDFFNLGLIYPLFTFLIFEEGSSFLASGASEFQKNILFGLLMAAFPFGQFFGATIIGHLSDSYGRRKLLIFSLIGTVATLLLCGLGVLWSSLLLLLFSRLIGGLMAGNLTLAYAALADLSAPEEKVRNFALLPLVMGAGFSSGPYFAGLLLNPEFTSWASPALPFFAAALLSIVNLILVVMKFPKSEIANVKGSLGNIFEGVSTLFKAVQNRSLQPYLWILFSMISANFLFVQFVGPLAVEKYNLDVTGVGYLYANIGISVALGHLFVTRRLADYYSPEKALSSSLIVLGVLLIALTLSTNLIMLHIISAVIMLACAVGYTNSMTIVSNCAAQDSQGKMMGIAVSVQNCSEFLPAVMVGMIASASQSLSMLTAALFAFSSFFVLAKLKKLSPIVQK
jgi:DHA1 family tetracycline resistance protein-like MFS transporter